MRQSVMERIGEIRGLDQSAMELAKLHINNLTVPPGSLGKLEAMAIQLAGITGNIKPSFDRREVIIMAGDHGVCDEGVSAFPQEVTPQMIHNFLAGGAAVNVLARQAGAEVVCVDIGVNSELSHSDLLSHKIRYGTANMAQGPAMSYDEAMQSIMVGVKVVEDAVKRGVQLFITGEMGIGNTTASSAVICALSDISVRDAVGRGTGIDDSRLQHKISVVERALEVNSPDPNDPVDVLSKVGGLEIGGLVGVILGAAVHGCPVIIDGFISSAAALLAKAICPVAADYMIVSHASHEQGHRRLLEELNLRPVLELDLRIGEGTGGVLCLHLVDAACRIVREMATFESAGISGETKEKDS
ncbi:nicotinate-nucleotide--dimethylbenzimidazole phosphoribosyltransferase [Paenibacillus sp. EC2-1]|uniref:nicotinate-nucleotide--dimethylbenzimidazole phosphoribosyltransferase n=1 Tax=Paenibacillus sp. EC2-1 TaxID=3388665 RepID=UPI003BEF359E